MNKVFDKLDSSIQSQILKLNNPEQIVVMMEIMRQTSQKNMNNKLDDTFSTKILPTSAADELYKEMPILTVETNNNNNPLTDDKQSDTSNNTTSNTSGDSSIKKVSII